MNDLARSDVLVTFSDVLAPYIAVFFVAWTVTIVVTPLMRAIAVRYGIVDRPDLGRKRHLEPVAYLGGLAIFIGWLAGIVVSRWITPHMPELFEIKHVSFPPALVAGAVVITIVGLIDDLYGISPRVKVGGQLFAAAMVASTDLGTTLMHRVLTMLDIPDPVWFERAISHTNSGIGPSYVLGAFLIAFFIIGACNAVNLLDGLDGLVAGVLSISCIGFLVITCYVAINSTNPEVPISRIDLDPVRLVMCMAILGALLGFLPHNFSPANIFMGDTGSLLLGYLCATMIMLFAQASKHGLLLVTAAMIVFALPIIDTSLAIFRRVMARQPILAADNHHLHHQFVRAFDRMGCRPTLSVKLAVASMYLLSCVFAALGCSLVFVRLRFVIAVFVVIFGFVAVIGYKSGYRQALMIKSGRGIPGEGVDGGPTLFDEVERASPTPKPEPAPQDASIST